MHPAGGGWQTVSSTRAPLALSQRGVMLAVNGVGSSRSSPAERYVARVTASVGAMGGYAGTGVVDETEAKMEEAMRERRATTRIV